MARGRTLFRNQTKGLLIRTWHYQRRQRCDICCNFIISPILLIVSIILQKTIKAAEVESFPFQRNPQGAFAARPFNPARCVELVEEFKVPGAEKFCAEGFVPKFKVPTFVPERLNNIVGSRNTRAEAQNKGILGELSLEPFIYPGALPGTGSEFNANQTSYDGVFLHSYFSGDSEDPLYKNLVEAEKTNQVDERYEIETIPRSSQTDLFSFLYGSWLKGNLFAPYSTALSFSRAERTRDEGIRVSATLFYNESESSNCTESCSLVSTVINLENAIFKTIQPGSSATAFLRRMPPIPNENDLGFIKLIISIVIGIISHFMLPSFLQLIVMERSARLRSMMEVMGLRKTNYWFGTYLGLLAQFILAQVLIIIVGAAVGISFYTDNTPLSYLILFFLWYVKFYFHPNTSLVLTMIIIGIWLLPIFNYGRGNVLIAHAIFFSPFFTSPETAQTFGWFFVLLVNLVGGPFLGRRLGDETTTEDTWAAIMLLPSFAFLRSVYFAGALNSGGKGITMGAETYRDVELGICQGRGIFCRSYAFLAVEFVILFVLGLYFDLVVPNAQGTRLHPLFFLGFKRRVRLSAIPERDERDDIGADVLEEESRAAHIVQNIQTEPFEGVVLDKLSKTYPCSPPVKAVRGLSLVVKQNEVLCIMAPNGAGKTSAFRTLIGELEPTSGNAVIFGNSIISDMRQIHRSMGVTPQQDILWDVLSVQEHLFFYGRLKNLSGNRLKTEVTNALESVQLSFARKRNVQIISGGMKRRLSVSIALMGDPRFIILDEPSTGLDILAREKLWNSIQRVRENKSIVLTTHSLEEAEALSTRVAIMSQGQLKCVGTPEELKLRLGKGHHLSVSLPSSKLGALHDAVLRLEPQAVLQNAFGGTVEYVLPRSFAVARVFSMMVEQKDELRVRDWSIHQSTLEDVFLRVTERTKRETADETNV